MCGGVSDLEFLAVRRAEGADVCNSFLVRLDRCGRVCQRNKHKKYTSRQVDCTFLGFVREEIVKRNRQVSESMQFCQIAINGKKRGEGQQIKK